MNEAPAPSPSIPSVNNRAPWGTVLLVFLIALAARAGYGIVRGGGELAYDDEQWYWALSRSLLAGHGLVGEFGHRAERMPLYPWLLSWFEDYQSARMAQWVVGALGASLAGLLAARVGAPAWIAGLLVALDPALVGSSSLLLTETVVVTLTAGLWLAAWPLWGRQGGSSTASWVAVAPLVVLGIYVRESQVLFGAALLVLIVLVRRDLRSVLGAAAVGLLTVVALQPWAMRNETVLGSAVTFTTRGGISLYDGVRPGATGASDLAGIKDAAAVRGLDEYAWNEHFRREAWAAIEADPGRVARLAPVKLARTWSPVLNAAELSSRKVQLVFAAWYVPLYVLILLGMWSGRRKPATILGLLLPALCVCALHSVFVGSVRYRLVALPTLAVLAALSTGWALAWWRTARRARGATQ